MKPVVIFTGIILILTGYNNATPVASPDQYKLYPDALIESFQEKEKSCETRMHVSESFRNKIRQGDYINLDENGKCYIFCFLTSSGLYQNYDLQLQKLQTSFTSPVLSQLYQQCSPSIQADNPCETAYVFFVCYMRSKKFLNYFRLN